MKRVRFTCIVMIGLVAIALAFAGTPAEAGNLKGEYRFMVTEIRAFENPIDIQDISYCSEYGTIAFKANGTAHVTSTDRCVVAGGTPTSSVRESDFTYTLGSSGVLLMAEANDPTSITHCVVADGGAMLLCDADGRDGSVLQWQAIAVRK